MTRHKLQHKIQGTRQDKTSRHQDKHQEQSKKTGQDTSIRNRTSSKIGQDTSFKTRSKEHVRTLRHQGIRTSVRSKARRQDRTQASGQDKQQDRTRHHKFQDKTQAGKMYGMPSSSLSGTHSPVYGENIDYAIRIVEHFINFLPSNSGKLFQFVILA